MLAWVPVVDSCCFELLLEFRLHLSENFMHRPQRKRCTLNPLFILTFTRHWAPNSGHQCNFAAGRAAGPASWHQGFGILPGDILGDAEYPNWKHYANRPFLCKCTTSFSAVTPFIHISFFYEFILFSSKTTPKTSSILACLFQPLTLFRRQTLFLSLPLMTLVLLWSRAFCVFR